MSAAAVRVGSTGPREVTCLRQVTVRPAPEVDPPALDDQAIDELYAEARHRLQRPTVLRPRYVQGSLAVDFRDRHEDQQFGRQATATSELPDPDAWARQLLHALLECLSGGRSPYQLQRWMSGEVYERVTRRHRVSVRRGAAPMPRPQVRRLRSCSPADGVSEISAVVWHESRVRAVALRLNGADGRWMVTELEIG